MHRATGKGVRFTTVAILVAVLGVGAFLNQATASQATEIVTAKHNN
jgi:hypothetical protein